MAYAAVVSLMNTIERLSDPSYLLTRSVYKELQSLLQTLKRLDTGGSKRSMDRKVIRSDWSMIDALDGRNYRSVDWSMINLLFEGNNNSNSRRRSINRRAIDALDARIRDTVWKLEDVIQSHVLSFPLFHPLGDIFSFLEIENGLINEYIIELEEHNKNTETMEQEILSFSKTVNMLEKEYIAELCTPLHREEYETVVSPADEFGGENSTAIGLFDQIEQIRNELLDIQPGNQVVSLFGMAGIGKTRLAREIYRDPITVQHFDYTAWLSIGPSNEMEDILADIVSQIERKPRDVYIEEDRYTLAMFIQRCLQGRRFLIVLDDIWSTEVCDYLIGWLPIYGNGKVLLTTRLEEVAICQSASFHQVPFLDHEDSWNLLWRNVFGGESFPPQLEKVGRKIAELCEGLPLLILTVASILCKFEKTEEYWNKVVVKQTTTFTDAYEMIYKVLISSYEYLPQHLKPHFLYMGVFPQRCVIRLSKLIDLWFVEDLFVPRVEDLFVPRVKDSEDFARGCMKGLVSNSLAIICKQSYNYTIIKSCKLHSAYWHLCVKEAKRIKFVLVLNKLADASEDYLVSQRRLAVQNNVLFGIKEAYDSLPAASTARSLLCTGEDHQYPVPLCLNLTLLKVLDALSVRLYEFPEEVMKLLLLRYLSLTHNGKVPSSISKLQNLQFLILSQHHNIKFLKDSRRWDMEGQSSNQLLRDSTCLPNEIWDMQQLKHLCIPKHNLPDPGNGSKLRNLFTLYVNAHSCTDDVFKSIPNLKKLGISIELRPDGAETLSLENIGLLDQLVSLKCVVVNPHVTTQIGYLSNLPRYLMKLSLNGLGYSWKYMSAIGSLPILKVLKLRCSAFRGAEWKTGDGEFPRLEYLLLEDMDIVKWAIHKDDQSLIFYHDSFQNLQHLIIRHCFRLREIPWRIGDIHSLKRMEVVDCGPSVIASAQQIQKKRSSVQLLIESSWKL